MQGPTIRGGGDDESGAVDRCRASSPCWFSPSVPARPAKRSTSATTRRAVWWPRSPANPTNSTRNKTSAYFSFEVLENVYDTLVEPDDNLEMRPALAESWDVSPDQLTWTFHLRQGVTFHDGSLFTADDVVYSYRRIIDEELTNADKFSAVTDVRATDPATVVITAQAAHPEPADQPRRLQGHGDRAAQERRERPDRHPPGRHRPVRVRRPKSGDSITLDANPDYWGGAPKVSG